MSAILKGQAAADAIRKAAYEKGKADAMAEATRTRPTESGSKSFDANEFSLARAIRSLANRDRSTAKKEWERSFDDPVCREIYIDRYGMKTLTLANDASAGFLVPPQVMRDAMIEYLRSALTLDAAGVRRMSGLTNSPVQIPRQSGAATAAWIGETSSVTATDQTVEMMSLNPKKAMASTKLSNTLLRKSPAAAEPFVREDLAATLERLIEVAFYHGLGASGQPQGLANVSGINTVSFSGSDNITKWTKLDTMIKEIEVDNGAIDNLVWAMSPTDYHILAAIQLPQASSSVGYPLLSSGNYVDKTARTLFGSKILTTTNITAGTLFLFNPKETILADWGAVEMRATSEGTTLASADLTQVFCLQEVDVGVRHAVSICTGTSFS